MLEAWFDNPNLTKLDEKAYEEMVDDYRMVYGNSRAVTVLLSELISLNFFQVCVSEEDRIKNNKAKELLCRLGIWRPEKAEEIVSKLLEVL